MIGPPPSAGRVGQWRAAAVVERNEPGWRWTARYGLATDIHFSPAGERRGMDLAHAAIWVTDLDRAVSFYEAIGLARRWSFEMNGVENVYVGDEHGELQLKHDPDRTTPVAPNRADVDHLAFLVDDVEETVAAALDAGASELTAPTVVDPADSYVAFVEDPEGYALEFVEPVG